MKKRKARDKSELYPGTRIFPPDKHPDRLDGGFYDLTDDFIGEMCLYSETDPAGSYTGIPRDDDTPIQDADDL